MFSKTMFLGIAIGILIAVLLPVIPNWIKGTTGL